jgi:hypothetical protein
MPLSVADWLTARPRCVSRSALEGFQPPGPTTRSTFQRMSLPTTCDQHLDKIILKIILEKRGTVTSLFELVRTTAFSSIGRYGAPSLSPRLYSCSQSDASRDVNARCNRASWCSGKAVRVDSYPGSALLESRRPRHRLR